MRELRLSPVLDVGAAQGMLGHLIQDTGLTIDAIEANPEWLGLLSRRIGAPVVLRAVPGLAISAGHVQSRFP